MGCICHDRTENKFTDQLLQEIEGLQVIKEKTLRKNKQKQKQKQARKAIAYIHYLCKRKLVGPNLRQLAVGRMGRVGHDVKD